MAAAMQTNANNLGNENTSERKVIPKTKEQCTGLRENVICLQIPFLGSLSRAAAASPRMSKHSCRIPKCSVFSKKESHSKD
ncbi:hypothetical protein CDAR_433311 [Caerostris darwini]|uniref:Uncharacterized protein n=1 Tax=Caerostris darwini TaxID=1538125 RepID=A0AAV4QI71_9ARAC|nr:hypothetical protein CDAR_433311 [Caerostris darwini]